MSEAPQREQDLAVDQIEGETEEIDAIPVPAGEGPQAGLPASGAPASGAPASGLRAPGAPASGLRAPGAPAPGLPAPARAVSQSLSSLRTAPTIQAAAVAAGGFVAGAAVVGLVRRRSAVARGRRGAVARDRRRTASVGGRGRRAKGSRQNPVELLQIVGSRSLLVDVHLLGPAGRRR